MFHPKKPADDSSASKSLLTNLFDGLKGALHKGERGFDVGFNRRITEDDASWQPLRSNKNNNTSYSNRGLDQPKANSNQLPPEYIPPAPPPLRKN